MKYSIFEGDQWFHYEPLEGCDPNFTDSTFRVGAVHYARALIEGCSVLEAHCRAEHAMFESQRSLGNIIRPSVIKKNRTT